MQKSISFFDAFPESHFFKNLWGSQKFISFLQTFDLESISCIKNSRKIFWAYIDNTYQYINL